MGNRGLQQPFYGGCRMFPISAIWLNGATVVTRAGRLPVPLRLL
jgi:hypothetical protein